MSDNQAVIQDQVLSYFSECSLLSRDVNIDPQQVSTLIDKLNRNTSPGADGVTSEHLSFGKSDILCNTLAKLFSTLLTYSVVPSVFTLGIIVPFLKKPTLNPHNTGSFRPITLSATLAKLFECLIMPEDKACYNQYGFRQGRSTSMPSSFLHDVTAYFKSQKTPLHVSSLDAEKCFDRIWHPGLQYKLIPILPASQWVFCFV